MLKRAYIEITNSCNLACSFCPGTRRAQRSMSVDEFRLLARRLAGHVTYLYLHVMGEPLLHPQLEAILATAGELGFRVCITTNGTLLGSRGGVLLAEPCLHKVSISLHSMEGNGVAQLRRYLEQCWAFAGQAARGGAICALRLWNIGGQDRRNGEILDFLAQQLGRSPLACPQSRPGSWRLGERLYLEQAERFDWPDLTAPQRDTRFCLGLREQIAVLADGTVVPCCLDHEGDIPLGDLFRQELADILASPRAAALYDGFSRAQPSEELCRRCGYATRFSR